MDTLEIWRTYKRATCIKGAYLVPSGAKKDSCFSPIYSDWFIKRIKVRRRAKIRNRYNQAPHMTQDTNGKVTTSQLDITNESQKVSPFQAGDHKASINKHTQKHNKNKTEITKIIRKRSTAFEWSVKIFYWRA